MAEASWHKGKHPDHVLFVIEVYVRKDHRGQLSCRRCLQSAEDERVAEGLPSGGMVEGGWALLTEAVRTEATLQLLVKLSNDPFFQEKLLEGEDVSEEFLETLARETDSLLQRELREILPQVAREVTRTIRDGIRSQTG
jgi:hypothetical protein